MRIVLQKGERLSQWDELHLGVSSVLLAVECRRTLDQLRHRGELADADVLEKRRILNVFLTRLEMQPLDEHVLEIAADPLPTNLATLDALHLATALLYRATETPDERLLFATHDHALARAAEAMRFEVIGV